MSKNHLYIFITALSLLYCTNAMAQRHLKIDGGMDTTSISTKIINGKSTARIIIESGIKLDYTTNMEKIVPYISHGENSNLRTHIDTLYFCPTPNDNVRKITIKADKYFPYTTNVIKLYAKSTYKFKVYDKERPRRGYDIPLIAKNIYFNVNAGAITMLNQAAIGGKAEFGVSIKLSGILYAYPTIGYNYINISPQVSRNFIELTAALKLCPSEKWHFAAGYVYTFWEYSDNGISLQCTRALKHNLYIKGNINYYVKYKNPFLGISLGINI